MAVLHPAHPHVTVHDWDDPCRPSLASVLDVIRDRPLPEQAATEVTSFRIAHHLPERRRKRALTAEYDTSIDFTRHADNILADLNFVESLLAVVAEDRAGALCPAWPGSPSLVLQLVTVCLSKLLDNAVFHDAAWIALRRLPLPLAHLRHLGEKYARVPLLVTLPVSPLAAGHTLSPAESDESSASEVSEVAAPFSDLSELLAAGMRLELPEHRYEWMELPVAPRSPLLQRNVFAADSSQHSLCILIVADPDTLCDAMSSALYHRLAWGLRGPLAGVSYLPDSPVVALHLGWLEDSICSSDDLPQVHIVGPRASPSVHNERPENSFSMADPGDVLSLARILLSLKHCFAENVRAARLLNAELLPEWRADQEAVRPPATTGWTARDIEDWSRQTESGQSPDVSPPISTANGVGIDSYSTHSFDRFVGLKEMDGSLPTAASLWLLDRLVAHHSLPPIDVYHNPATYDLLGGDIRAYVPSFVLYRRATQFTWPCSWQSLDSLPPLPRTLQDSGRDLFFAFSSCHDGALHRLAATGLGNEACRILERELVTVLRVADLGRSLNATSRAQTCQMLYDMMFTILVPHTATQILSGVEINLSRSTIHDIVTSESVDDALLALGRMQRLHFWTHTAEARLFRGIDKDRWSLLRGAVQRASSDENFRYIDLDSVRQRIMHAPTLGACDVVLAARFSLPFHAVVGPRPLPSIIGDHSLTVTSRTFPLPFRPDPQSFDDPMAMWRILTFDIVGLSHQDYPSAEASSRGEATSGNFPAGPRALGSPDAARDDLVSRSDNSRTIDFPVLLVVHSARRACFNIADSNRLRMCLTSAVQFLVSMQILDFPLFGLLTEGTVCAVVMAWATKNEGQEFAQVHMIDQNCTSYDLSDPAGAFNFATFLLWVQYEHVPRLLARLNEAHRAGLYSKLVTEDDCSAWSAAAQLKHVKQTLSADPDYHASGYFACI